MAGLPAVGKSAIADALARDIGACVLSIDSIETAMVRSDIEPSFETGLAAYNVAAAITAHQLDLGHHVIVDAANYVEAGRDIWRRVARDANVLVTFVEIVCSDEAVHRKRLQTRRRDFAEHLQPTWQAVLDRRVVTEPWSDPHLVLDSINDLSDNVRTAVDFIATRPTVTPDFDAK